MGLRPAGLRLCGVRSGAAEVCLQKRHHLSPQLGRGLRPVRRPVVGEEGVADALVDVDFDLLSAGGGSLAQLLCDLGGGIGVLGADYREQRAAQLSGKLERRRGALGRGGVLRGGFV